MKRLLVNGSPRGIESNSRLILDWMIQGMKSQGSDAPEIIDLAVAKKFETNRNAFLNADEVLVVLPLYTDSVPGIVKNFIDTLPAADKSQLIGKRVGFVIQSGFPESIHSEALSTWLARLCARLGFVSIGIAIKGGVEGIRVMPESMTRKVKAQFIELGATFAQTGNLDPLIIKKMVTPRTFGKGMLILLSLLIPTGLLNSYWNSQLKTYGAWKQRFDRPYA